MTVQIALLVAFTTRKCHIETFHDLVLARYLLPCLFSNRHRYPLTLYLGYDTTDPYFSTPHVQKRAFEEWLEDQRLAAIEQGAPGAHDIQFNVTCVDNPYHNSPCFVWNYLAKKAAQDGAHYFYQLGDDITFRYDYWDELYVATLQAHHDIGVTGCLTTQMHMLTQLFVSRRHLEIFETFFPPAFRNWYCDDFFRELYAPSGHVFIIHQFAGANHYVVATKRYETDPNGRTILGPLAEEARARLASVLHHLKK